MGGQPPRGFLFSLFRQASPLEWVIACTVLLIFIQYGLLPREVFFAPDEGMRVIVSRNLQPASVFTGIVGYESRPVDPDLAFVPYFDRWFSVAPGPELRVSYPIIWFAALIAPLYALGGAALAQLFPILCGALAGLLAGRILDLLAGRSAATLGAISVMLAIPSSLYSLLLWEHQLSVALCLLALLCWVEHRTRPRLRLAGVGAAAAMCACALRIETLFIVAPALLWVGYAQFVGSDAPIHKRLVVVGVALALVGLLIGLYWFVARDRLPTLAPALAPAQLERSVRQVLRVFIGYDASAFTGIALLSVLLIGSIALVVKRQDLSARVVIVSGVLVAVSLITALSILRVAPFRVVNPGLLCGAPLLVVAVLPLNAPMEDARLRFLRRVLLTVFIGSIVGTFLTPRLASRAGGVMVQIGSTWGSRYLLALYPLMAVTALANVAVLLRLARAEATRVDALLVNSAVPGVGLTLALTVGILVNLVGLIRIETDKRVVLPECQAVWQAGADVLITDDWWRAPECASRAGPAYLLVQSPQALPALRRALFENSSDPLELAYASQSGRLSLQAVVDELEACFLVRQSLPAQNPPAGQVTRLSLWRRVIHCYP